MRQIKVGKHLTCGCCGVYFQTWEGYVDQDQDNGYGICKPCQEMIRGHEEAEFDKGIQLISNHLNPKNKAKFDAYDREIKKRLVMKAIEDGVIKFSIRRKRHVSK